MQSFFKAFPGRQNAPKPKAALQIACPIASSMTFLAMRTAVGDIARSLEKTRGKNPAKAAILFPQMGASYGKGLETKYAHVEEDESLEHAQSIRQMLAKASGVIAVAYQMVVLRWEESMAFANIAYMVTGTGIQATPKRVLGRYEEGFLDGVYGPAMVGSWMGRKRKMDAHGESFGFVAHKGTVIEYRLDEDVRELPPVNEPNKVTLVSSGPIGWQPAGNSVEMSAEAERFVFAFSRKAVIVHDSGNSRPSVYTSGQNRWGYEKRRAGKTEFHLISLFEAD